MSNREHLCLKCNKKIPRSVRIKGIKRSIKNREYCLTCVPWIEKESDVKQSLETEAKKISEVKKDKELPKKRIIKVKENRKRRLVKLSGGKCKKCGYRKTQRALSFHHLNPEEKSFCLSKNNLRKPWKVIKKEFKKCDLLCLNCHAEVEELIEKRKNFCYDKWLSEKGKK